MIRNIILSCIVVSLATTPALAQQQQQQQMPNNFNFSSMTSQMPSNMNLNSIISQIPGFGNMTSAGQLNGMLNNSAVTGALGNMSAQQQGGFLDNLLKGAMGNNMGGNPLSSIFASGSNGNSLLSGTISKIAPALTAALGGQGGIAAAVGSLASGGGGLGGAAAAAAGGQTGGQQQPGQNNNGGGGGGGGGGTCCQGCPGEVSSCSGSCSCTSDKQKQATIKHLKEEFIKHREWMVKTLFEKHLLPALMLFAEQITAMAMHQVVVIGAFLDAKHQLEGQRLFQEMMARAHKDYQPSEGMCVFGTAMRSLAASDRNMDLSAMGFSNRLLQRELLSGNSLAGNGRTSDLYSRIQQFRSVYCDKADNAGGLGQLCTSPKDPTRANNDINFTAVIDQPATLMLDFTEEGDPDHQKNKNEKTVSPDEEDVFALMANLFAHQVAPTIAQTILVDENGKVNDRAVRSYMNVRALAAKRSVARNSFAAIAAMKSQGEKEVKPYMYALLKEMGVASEDEIKKFLGERPSYYAQMEMLTKKIYQNPMFYTELYDKPANVARKLVSMQAIELMQRRDIYRSSLRSEATLSVMLETALMDQQTKVVNEINTLGDTGEPIKLPGD